MVVDYVVNYGMVFYLLGVLFLVIVFGIIVVGVVKFDLMCFYVLVVIVVYEVCMLLMIICL